MEKNFLLIIIGLFFTSYIVVSQELDYPKKMIKGKEFYEYTVQKSEGLYAISKKFDVTRDEIVQANPNMDNNLKRGTILYIPVKKRNYILHKVEKKETLFSLTQKYGVTLEELYEINPSLQTDGLKADLEIKIPQKPKTFSHEVKAGETLYSISRRYEVTTEEIISLNPEARDGIQTGKSLLIPDVSNKMPNKEKEREKERDRDKDKYQNKDIIVHEVQKEETLYSISKKYNISQDEIIASNPGVKDGLKAGKTLVIFIEKTNANDSDDTNNTNNTNVNVNTDQGKTDVKPVFVRSKAPKNTINIALALPFQLNKVSENDPIEKNIDKFLELYQGILLAADSLKKQGFSINLNVYDSGKSAAELEALLSKPELKEMDLLIGPGYASQIKPFSEFVKSNNIKLIIPFSSKTEETKSNPNIFQLNAPQKEVNQIAARQFVSYFGSKNIILVRFKTTSYDDKSTFAEALETALKSANVKYSVVWFDTMENIRRELADGQENIIALLTTNQGALVQSLPMINTLGEKKNISLFGFSEWQNFQNINKELFRLNTYIATPFFIDYKDQDVKNYLRKYRYFYNSEPANNAPQYGLLGYDIIMYFSKAISKYGFNFEKEMGNLNVKQLQMNFKFKKMSESGGYFNSNVFLTNHNSTTGVTEVGGGN